MATTAVNLARREWGWGPAAAVVKSFLWPLQVVVSFQSLLFFGALGAMLLRPPNVDFFPIDRLLFGLLVVSVLSGTVLRRQAIQIRRASWPMLALTGIALASVVTQSYDNEVWSLLAGKFIVPFALFHLAQQVFTKEGDYRRFEVFSLVVLAYLSFTSIAFLVGAKSLIFPRFILDESLGHHADRARGPLLQAVANGVSLNLLALITLHAYRRNSIHGVKAALVLLSVPVAILATMTRAVWLAFAGTVVACIVLSKSRRMRQAGLGLVILAGAGLGVSLCVGRFGETVSDRLEERSPVEYRQAVYAGGWQMFLQHPLTGWGFHSMPAELPRFVGGYQEKELYPHNTYLELLVEHGLIGLALYLWLMWEMFRLGRSSIPDGERHCFLNRDFHRLWLVLLAVYYVNAAVAVMSYQFVNGLLYSMAGMLAAQRERTELSRLC
ncbi:MAG TPA: O-antigen ligase family protein [Candidatus Sulfotelmatobacter sp.]|nr:O-antigen ligase family protein [Candidatus Sulfotelmatobacter sp.]